MPNQPATQLRPRHQNTTTCQIRWKMKNKGDTLFFFTRKNKSQLKLQKPKNLNSNSNSQPQTNLRTQIIKAAEPNLKAGKDIVVNRGLYVGRFQPFHIGHLDAIKYALENVDELVVVIGSAQYSHNRNDPFTAGERLMMVHNALLEADVDFLKVWIVPVPDVHLHMLWVSAVEGYTPKFNVVFSNEPLTRRLFMEAGYVVKNLPLFDRKLYTSTHVREKMIQDGSWSELVPKSVAKFIDQIDGVNRVRDLARTDKVT